MLIDKESKKLIKLLRSGNPDGPRDSYSYEQICKISGLDENEMFRIVKNLVDVKCAEYVYRTSRQGRRDYGIALTQRGYRFDEYARLEAVERWKERILGFIMGAGATLVGVMVRYLLYK